MIDRYAQEAYRNAERLRQSAEKAAESNESIQQELKALREQYDAEITRIKLEQQKQARSDRCNNAISITISLLALVSAWLIPFLL